MKILWLASMASILLAGVLFLNSEPDSPSSRSRESEPRPNPIADFPFAAADANRAASAPSQTAARDSANALTRVNNTYAAVIHLRQQRLPGSFAKSSLLISLCENAISGIYASRFRTAQRNLEGLQSSAAMTDAEIRRNASLQATEARCRDVADDHQLRRPLEDDVYGQAFETARKHLTQFSSFEERKLALEQLKKQGGLVAAYRELAAMDGGPIFFNGKYLRGAEAIEFQAATNYYFLTGSEFSSAANQDLRYLAVCNRAADCPDDPREVILGEWNEEQKARIAALAAAIGTALESGDIQTFMPQAPR